MELDEGSNIKNLVFHFSFLFIQNVSFLAHPIAVVDVLAH